MTQNSLEVLRQHRIVRVQKMNEKLGLDLQKTRGELVELEPFKAAVLNANLLVKQLILAVPFQQMGTLATLSEPREMARVLHAALVECLNHLAFETERVPRTCATCGHTL